MKELLDTIFPTLSDELIIVISLIIGLLITASLILFLVKKIFPKTNISELSARTRSWWIRPDGMSHSPDNYKCRPCRNTDTPSVPHVTHNKQ